MTRLYTTYTITDPRARLKKNQFEALGLKNKIGAVYLADCYTIDAKLDSKKLEKAKHLLANPLIQKTHTNPSTLPATRFSHAIEIGFLPGVTDNVGHTARETLQDGAKIKFKPGQNVYTSQVFFISGKISFADANKIALSLHNPLIQKASITSWDDFKKTGLGSGIPKVKIKSSNKILKVNLNVGDEELAKLGKLGIPDYPIPAKAGIHKNGSPIKSGMEEKRRGPLALSLGELKAIQAHFKKLGRQPTDVELEALAQTWSEHCKHTIFSDPIDEIKEGIFKHYIKRATEVIRKKKGRKDFCVSVFTDNAGGISFDSKNIIAYKVETHNTPSALDPFGGSITGIGGVNRDALGFGLGAKPVANFYGFCLADPGDKTKLYRDKQLKNPMLSSRRIMDGVVAGINAGGNQSGIPTPLGFLFFDSRYRGKPLVFAGTLGLIPKKIGNKKSWVKKAESQDLIVMVGGRVGMDGIHGATFSSEGLSSHSPATAVQIGDPITQKKFSDTICKEARDLNLYNSITDCGAGGISSAVGEMAKEAGGCLVELDKVPVKYPGLAPWQIWISESQERMVLAVPKNKWQKFLKLMNARGVEATVIGKFTQDNKCVVKYNGKNVLDLEMEFLHNGRPKQQQTTRKSKPVTHKLILQNKKDFSADVLKMLARLNITSTEFVNTQYDHEVQGTSILKPLQGRGKINSEAAVIRPLLDSKKGVVLSYGLNPLLSETDAYKMSANSIDAAIRSAVAAGANVNYMAILDNFCWCSPHDPKRLYQLKKAAQACFDIATAYGTPFISGKDSMHNDFKGFGNDGKPLKISIPPTLLITTMGVIENVEKAISLDVKLPGDLLYILGETNNELAGSEYLNYVIPAQAGIQKLGIAPSVNTDKNLKLYRSFYQAVQNNLVASAISVNRGGLAVAVSKSVMGGGLGVQIDLKNLPGNWKVNAEGLFSESAGRILVSVAPQNAQKFEKLMHGNVFAKIGQVGKNPKLVINSKDGKQILNVNLNAALKEYKSTFKDY